MPLVWFWQRATRPDEGGNRITGRTFSWNADRSASTTASGPIRGVPQPIESTTDVGLHR